MDHEATTEEEVTRYDYMLALHKNKPPGWRWIYAFNVMSLMIDMMTKAVWILVVVGLGVAGLPILKSFLQ